jgi:hypothetical protein
MWHICVYKLATTYTMTLMYLLVNIHIKNQSTLCKVNGVVFVPDWLKVWHAEGITASWLAKAT